ncbi:MAG: tetratricopeptide repeat protein [Roseibacillus sp.]
MSITPDKAPESLLASDPNALFLQRTDEINELLDSGASLSGHERNCLFLNTGGGHFATASATSGFDFYDDARAVARSDWDHDGDVDLWFANRTAPRLRFLRNNGKRAAHFVALRLRGTSSNGDGIGARVVIKSGKRTLLRSLRAGEGFLGQSSKWLHFGLGTETAIDSLVVHWPGGNAESFSGALADGWFALKQGEGRAKRWQPPKRELRLAKLPFSLPDSSEQAAVRLCARMPIPRLTCYDSAGKAETIAPAKGRGLFVSIWASWCPACQSEFTEFAAHKEELKKANFDMLALCVNGLGEGDDTTFADGEVRLKKFGINVSHRRADTKLLEQLRIIANRIIAQNDSLPLPSGFLLDPDGKVAAFYRGPAPVKRLLADAATLSLADPAAIFRAGLPYKGTWIGDTRVHPLDRLVNEFIDAEFTGPGLEFARKHRSAFASPKNYAEVFSRVGNRHAAASDLDAAIGYYREALVIDDKSPTIHFNLALAFERQRRVDEALVEYQRAITLDPSITVAHLNRGAILARGDAAQLSAGIASLEEAVRLNPNLGASHYQLGMALERAQQFPKALHHYRRAALLAPDHFGNAMQLAHLLERGGQFENALTEYRKIQQIHPRSAQAAFQSGLVLEKLKRAGEAATAYRECLALNPDYVPALNNLGWLLATSETPAIRQPAEALRHAAHAAKLTGFKQAEILDTLATAQFAAGQKESARATLSQAIPIARAAGQAAFAEELEAKLLRYQDSRN